MRKINIEIRTRAGGTRVDADTARQVAKLTGLPAKQFYRMKPETLRKWLGAYNQRMKLESKLQSMLPRKPSIIQRLRAMFG